MSLSVGRMAPARPALTECPELTCDRTMYGFIELSFTHFDNAKKWPFSPFNDAFIFQLLLSAMQAGNCFIDLASAVEHLETLTKKQQHNVVIF